ncbi:hypothetical protein [Paenibacillus radicis (ex Gao et al. 2016)]|uniref:Uncharacterized protein n=1 Tax=Paenibacillus radicis (ex Gao et al. 2016) TaxID=1737354 RepID=A0A917HKL9_9BACL|nr:hypothetical protein [Paenibacillus radicis (ex Gao et al. 2016)]GGG82128.1 hypothetical protein GCM10010918_44340 [Paenibacillus radicis (ex Gao et al. 2016)]
MVSLNDVSEEERVLFVQYKSLVYEAIELSKRQYTYEKIIGLIQSSAREYGADFNFATVEEIILRCDVELSSIRTTLILNELEQSKLIIKLGETFADLSESYPDDFPFPFLTEG